jgi:hypothetical protein
MRSIVRPSKHPPHGEHTRHLHGTKYMLDGGSSSRLKGCDRTLRARAPIDKACDVVRVFREKKTDKKTPALQPPPSPPEDGQCAQSPPSRACGFCKGATCSRKCTFLFRRRSTPPRVHLQPELKVDVPEGPTTRDLRGLRAAPRAPLTRKKGGEGIKKKEPPAWRTPMKKISVRSCGATGASYERPAIGKPAECSRCEQTQAADASKPKQQTR